MKRVWEQEKDHRTHLTVHASVFIMSLFTCAWLLSSIRLSLSQLLVLALKVSAEFR